MATNSTSVDPGISSTPVPSSTSFSPVPSSPSFTQSVPPDNGETTVIDDTDPSITYTASNTIPWNVTSDTTAYNHTTHQTTCNSCPATLLFNGTGLSLTSIISTAGSNFMVWVDGTSAGPFSLQNDVEQAASVYSIEGLQLLQHNATFMKYSNDPNDSSFFNIDSITVINRPNTGASYVPPTPSGRTSVTETQTGASPSDSNTAPIASESSPPPIGAIVGGTIGGVALIIVVVAWIIIMRRRKAAANAPAYAGERYADRYSQDHKPQERYAERKPQDRYAQDHYPQDAQGARRSADRRSGEKYRSGYADPRYAPGYSSSNNGYSRGNPSSRVPSSRAASRY